MKYTVSQELTFTIQAHASYLGGAQTHGIFKSLKLKFFENLAEEPLTQVTYPFVCRTQNPRLKMTRKSHIACHLDKYTGATQSSYNQPYEPSKVKTTRRRPRRGIHA